jgi:hypothetical protein
MALQRRLARLEQRRGARPMRFVLVRAGDPEPVARAGELLFVMCCHARGGCARRLHRLGIRGGNGPPDRPFWWAGRGDPAPAFGRGLMTQADGDRDRGATGGVTDSGDGTGGSVGSGAGGAGGPGKAGGGVAGGVTDAGDWTGGTLGTGSSAAGKAGGARKSDEMVEGMSEAGKDPAAPSAD